MSGCCGGTAELTAERTIRTASTELTLADRLGALRMRFDIGRSRYRVDPGLYRVGSPSPSSPVLVTANYKLTFDAVRAELSGVDAWLLVLDTKGINVWCAAGKQTFGTMELCRRVIETGLSDVVEHRKLILPQLGAPGVAAHDVQAFTGFRVLYGPVRAADIPAFLDAGMKTTPEMRRVRFGLRDRFVLTGVEIAMLWRPKTLAVLAALVLAGGVGWWGLGFGALLSRGGLVLAAAIGGLVAGAFVTPLLLPWLPFRAFAAKGALVGALAGAALYAGFAPVTEVHAYPAIGYLGALAAAIATTTISSYSAMNFTGSSAITSPSGVQYEMRRALPWQIAGAAGALLLWIASAIVQPWWW